MAQGEFNPYQAPLVPAPLLADQPGVPMGIWRDGSVLIMAREARLPERCVLCNAPADGGRLKRNLQWHSPWIYIFILAGLLIYVILALILMKRATIEVGLCEAHRARRIRMLLIAWSTALFLPLALVGIVVVVGNDVGWLLLFFPILILIGAIIGLYGARVVVPKEIDDRWIWLKGIHPDFLAMFPDARPGR